LGSPVVWPAAGAFDGSPLPGLLSGSFSLARFAAATCPLGVQWGLGSGSD
jgi:hypothetical protein